MADDYEYELLKTPDEPPPARSGPGLVWIIVAVLFVVALAAAAYVVFGRRAPPPEQAAAQRGVKVTSRDQPLGSAPPADALPPLNESDALVRELVSRISSHPQLAAWLATDDVVRRFAIVVDNVAQGRTPAKQMTMNRPSTAFRVVDGTNGPVIDPRSYERYDTLAAAAASLDPEGVARTYGTLKPRIEDAARELGPAGFDRTLERAIVLLLQTPVIQDPIRVEPKGIGYRFADPEIEKLTAAQKQLLRMGPRNLRQVQSALRAIARELGIPAERLPAPPADGGAR